MIPYWFTFFAYCHESLFGFLRGFFCTVLYTQSLSALDQTHTPANTFTKYPHFPSYLPIIVECCWTAASKRRSNIVHSPIVIHLEMIAHRAPFLWNLLFPLFYSPDAPISGECIGNPPLLRSLMPSTFCASAKSSLHNPSTFARASLSAD